MCTSSSISSLFCLFIQFFFHSTERLRIVRFILERNYDLILFIEICNSIFLVSFLKGKKQSYSIIKKRLVRPFFFSDSLSPNSFHLFFFVLFHFG
jgi:hypothetical protein